MRRITLLSLLPTALAACSTSQASPEDQAARRVKDIVTAELHDLHAAALAIQAAAPEPDADGWNATDDAVAVDAMKMHWYDARVSYERIEGAIAVLFPELDASTDERYEGFLADAPDDDLFDGEGVTGVHAIERILWSDSINPEVVAFESALDGYSAAAFPADATEAKEFRDGLAQRLVDDTAKMVDEFEPLLLDAAAAYRGVVGSMQEQVEKIELAATGEEESRYARNTLADMRANLDGGREIYGAFVPWLRDTGNGALVDGDIDDAFDRVQAAYDAIPGASLPPVPDGWSADPTDAQLATPYGGLYERLSKESDPDTPESLVSEMLRPPICWRSR